MFGGGASVPAASGSPQGGGPGSRPERPGKAAARGGTRQIVVRFFLDFGFFPNARSAECGVMCFYSKFVIINYNHFILDDDNHSR